MLLLVAYICGHVVERVSYIKYYYYYIISKTARNRRATPWLNSKIHQRIIRIEREERQSKQINRLWGNFFSPGGTFCKAWMFFCCVFYQRTNYRKYILVHQFSSFVCLCRGEILSDIFFGFKKLGCCALLLMMMMMTLSAGVLSRIASNRAHCVSIGRLGDSGCTSGSGWARALVLYAQSPIRSFCAQPIVEFSWANPECECLPNNAATSIYVLWRLARY